MATTREEAIKRLIVEPLAEADIHVGVGDELKLLVESFLDFEDGRWVLTIDKEDLVEKTWEVLARAAGDTEARWQVGDRVVVLPADDIAPDIVGAVGFVDADRTYELTQGEIVFGLHVWDVLLDDGRLVRAYDHELGDAEESDLEGSAS